MHAGTPDGWEAFGWVNPEGKLVIRVGCREFSYEEALLHWKDAGDDRAEVRAAVEYMKACAVIRGWKV